MVLLGMSGAVLADSIAFRLVVYITGALALLIQCIVLFGCSTSTAGGSSGLSNMYLVEFDVVNPNQTASLRVGYTAMCAVLNGGSQHCTTTVGKNQADSICHLALGYDTSACNNLPRDMQLSQGLFTIALQLQDQVLLCLPAVPAVVLVLGFIALGSHGIANRPFVGYASSMKQYNRNRHLDIIRFIIFGLLALATIFTFAIAVGASQMYSGIELSAGNTTPDPSQAYSPGSSVDGNSFTVKRGTGALAIHWTAVVMTLLFFIGVNLAITKLSMVSFALTPPDAAGTGATAFDMTSMQGPLEKASLLRSPSPMGGMTPPNGVTAEAAPPQGPMGSGGMGGRGGMIRGRGGMGMRGGMGTQGPMGMRGGMGARGGMMPRGR